MTRLLTLLLLLFAAGSAMALDGGWLMTTDYTSFGRIRGFDQGDPWAVTADLATVPGDAVARWHEGKVYVVGRGGANLIQVYDPSRGFALEREFSLGSGLNPQDIAFDTAGEAYVSCYDSAVLLRVDIPTETVLSSHDTSVFADADGLPETAWTIAVGDRLYIAVQKLDRNNWYTPTGPGAVAVFDMAAEQWVDTDPLTAGVQPIILESGNPYTRFDPVSDGMGGFSLRIGCAGCFGLADGGIEVIDTATDTGLGYLVTEVELGGDLIGLMTTGSSLHVLISDASYVTSLRRYVPATGQMTVLDSSAGYDHADLAWDGGFQLYLADRSLGASGLRVFDLASGAELTTQVIPTGLPPFMFVLPGNPGISPVPDSPFVGELMLGAPTPNPFNPRTRLAITGQPDSRVMIRVLDLRGHLVRTSIMTLGARGGGRFEFDGRDDTGRLLPAGVYRAVVQDGAGFAARSLTLIK